MKPTIHIIMLLCLSLGCSNESPMKSPVEALIEAPAEHFDAQAARSNILAALPSGWSAIPPSSSWQMDSITTEYFAHTQTESFLLIGPQSNYIDWTDRGGGRHREHLAKECLYIWLVLGDFKASFPRSRENWRAENLYSSQTIRAYGYIAHHIADTNRMDTILKEATKISSPEVRISWSSWQRDIGTSLKK